jgi:predicted PhzF superfamily epimerase YddE/YHI9
MQSHNSDLVMGRRLFLSLASVALAKGAGQARVFHTRAFAAGSKGGNPCPVSPDGNQFTDVQMQDVARRYGQEAVFLLKPQSKDADIRIRSFVPDHELASRTGRHEFRIAQGYAMGAPSVIEAISGCDAGKVTRAAIRGGARIVRRSRV